jgi:hypothetical protein
MLKKLKRIINKHRNFQLIIVFKFEVMNSNSKNKKTIPFFMRNGFDKVGNLYYLLLLSRFLDKKLSTTNCLKNFLY